MVRHSLGLWAIRAMLVLYVAAGVFAQTPVAPSFEVSSVKPTPPERQNTLRKDYCQSGGRFAVAGIPVIWSIEYAYRVRDFQILGAPDWLNQFEAAYDIEGNPAGTVDGDQCRLMVQSLFVDRFKLRAHRESRTSRVYLLTIAKNGPKLRHGGGVKLNGGVQVNASGKPESPDGLTMAALAAILSIYTDRPVLDRTGLQGSYGITLDFSRGEGDDRVSIFTAVQEQLGLKLENGQAPVEMLIIDHIERADEN
jgi:uncharacterized protein (TIGR03435 family)